MTAIGTFTDRAPALPLAAGLALGIVLFSIGVPLWAAAALAVAAIGVYLLHFAQVANVVLWSALGIAAAWGAVPPQISPDVLDSRTAHTAIVTDVQPRDTYQLITAEMPARVRLTYLSLEHSIEPGDTITFLATLERPHPIDSLPGQDYYVRNLEARGIRATALVVPDSIAIVPGTPSLMQRLGRLRADAARLIYTSGLSDSAAEFTAAILLGPDEELSDDMRMRFRRSGLAHVLALSGLHVGILVLIVSAALMPLQRIGFIGTRRHIITIALLWLYALFTGLSPSVTRAVVMVSIMLGAEMLQRRYSTWNALAWAAIIILLFAPNQLFDVGFQLSFVAVASIVAVGGFTDWLNRLPRWLRGPVNIAVASIAAVMGTAPLVAYNFGAIPVYFLPANIAVVWLLPFVLVCGIVLIALMLIGLPTAPVAWCSDVVCDATMRIADFFGSLPGGTITVRPFSPWAIATWFGALLLLWIALTIPRRRYASIAAIILLAGATYVIIAKSQDNIPPAEVVLTENRTFTELMVRAGDELLVVTTDRFADSTEICERYRTRMGGYLHHRGVERITPVLTDTVRAPLRRRGPLLEIGDTKWCIVDGYTPRPASTPGIDYMLVCTQFKGDIVEVAQQLKADTVVIARDIHPRRASRYADELSSAGIPHLSAPLMRIVK